MNPVYFLLWLTLVIAAPDILVELVIHCWQVFTVCFSGGMAAEELGKRPQRGPMRSHPHAEEKAPEYAELHTSSAEERALETVGPAGRPQPLTFSH